MKYAIAQILQAVAELPAVPLREFTPPMYSQNSDVRIKRAAAWIAKCPGAISGQGGNSRTFGTAAMLVRDFGLSEAEAWPLLWAWNDICDPVWTERDLRAKLSDALSKGKHPIGSVADRPKPERPKPPPDTATPPRPTPSGVNRLDQLCDAALAADPAEECAPQEKTFKRGGEVELGLDLAVTLGPRESVVCAENRIWQFTGSTWTRWEDETLAKTAQSYDGQWVVVPAREQGDADKFRPITLSAGNVKGIVQNCKTTLFAPKFFAEAPTGAPFANVFARIDGNEIIIEKMTRDHRVKSDHSAAYPLAPLAERAWTAETLLSQTWAGCDDFDQRIRYFWEWLGAAICGIATRYKDTPLLVGPKDTGKSQILHMISTCFPVSSHRAITLHAMSSEYHRAHLSGGRINFVNELPARELMDGEAAKAILSGEMVNCRYPAEKPFDWVPRCAHVFAANELPPSRDSALMDRLVLLDCANIVPRERQDRNLQAKLTAEAPQIAATALAALPALLARGHLIRPGSAEAATHLWQLDSNPIRAWANESLMEVNDFVTQGSVLYNHFCAWAKDNGHRAPASNLFAARLKAIGFAKETRQVVKWNAEIKSDARRVADGAWGNNSRYGRD